MSLPKAWEQIWEVGGTLLPTSLGENPAEGTGAPSAAVAAGTVAAAAVVAGLGSGTGLGSVALRWVPCGIVEIAAAAVAGAMAGAAISAGWDGAVAAQAAGRIVVAPGPAARAGWAPPAA